MHKPTHYFEWKWGSQVSYCVSKLETCFRQNNMYYIFESSKGQVTYQVKSTVDKCLEWGQWDDEKGKWYDLSNSMKLLTQHEYEELVLYNEMEAHLNES